MISVFIGGLVESLRSVPTAVIMASPDNAVIGAVIRLNAYASTDPDSNPLTYRWEFPVVPIGSLVSQEGFRPLDSSGAEVSFSPDIVGQYVIKLTVSNGLFESSATQLVTVRAILVPHGRGIVPDGKFIWSYIRDVWQGVDNKEVFETLWSALLQISGGELLKTYQVDFNKSIRDIQELYQRRWLNYDPRLNLDSDVSFYFGNQLAGSGASTVPLGTQGKAVILHPNEVIIARGSVLSQVATETFSVIYSTSQDNVGGYTVRALNKTRNGYIFELPVADSMADVVTKKGLIDPETGEVLPGETVPVGAEVIGDWYKSPVTVFFPFKSRIWTFVDTRGVDYALLMSKSPSPIDVYANLFSTQTDATPPGMRVGDVVHFDKGPNAGYYIIEIISGNTIQVDRAPPSASLPPSASSSPIYKVNIYHPVGFTLTQDEQVLTDTVALPFLASNRIGELAKGRLLTVNGQGLALSRSYADIAQSPPVDTVVTDSAEMLANQSNFNWRVPYTLVSATQNFEDLGVMPGDLLVGEVTNEVSQMVCEVRAQVVGVHENKIGFVLSTDPLTPGVVPPIPDQLYLDLSASLGILLATRNRDGQLVISDDMKMILTAMQTTGFARTYLNTEIKPTTDINILGGIFKVRPKYVIRNSKVPAPELLRSVPLLQEWIVQPETVERDGQFYQVKNDKEYALARRPTVLMENSDYLIDDKVVFKGEVFLNTNTKVVRIEGGFFQDRGLRPGDLFEILSPLGLDRVYRIVSVVDQDRLVLNLPIPKQEKSSFTYAACRVRITRAREGRYIRLAPGNFGPNAPAPDRLWAEVSFFDNSDVVENNFGLLVGLTRADLDRVSQNINYRQAVAGLMFAYTRGPEVNKIRLGAQILLGLPFSEHAGIIRSIDEDYRLDLYGNPVMGRVLIEDTDSEGVLNGTLRIYTYPIDYSATELTGIETNPSTGKSYMVGDSVEMFTALCKGVEVLDYVSSPLSAKATPKQQLQQFHSFRLRANDNIFNLNELALVSEFLRKITPSYINYALQSSTSKYDRVNILDLTRFGLKLTGSSGSTFADDVATGLAIPFMYDYASLSGGKYLYWNDGAYTPRLYGSDLRTEAGYSSAVSLTAGIPVSMDGPDMAWEGTPSFRIGDKLLIITGPDAGLYDINSVDEWETNGHGSSIQLSDAPMGGFQAGEDLSFIIVRPVTAELCRGSTPDKPYGSPDTPEFVTDILLQPGLRSNGVMPGDWLLGGWSNEGPTIVRRYTIRVVKESVPGSGIWDTVTIDRAMDGWLYDRGFDYRIYRPNLIPSPFLNRIAIYPSEYASPELCAYEFNEVADSNWEVYRETPWMLGLLEPGDEIILRDDYPTLTVKQWSGGYNLVLYLDQLLDVQWDSQENNIPYYGYIKKRGHQETTVGIDSKMLFPHDQVTVDLLSTTARAWLEEQPVEYTEGFMPYWRLRNLPSEALDIKPGDLLFITPRPEIEDHDYGPGYEDLGYGPGVYPILYATSDVDWIYLVTPNSPNAYEVTGLMDFEYRIRRVLLKTPTASTFQFPPPPPPPPPTPV